MACGGMSTGEIPAAVCALARIGVVTIAATKAVIKASTPHLVSIGHLLVIFNYRV